MKRVVRWSLWGMLSLLLLTTLLIVHTVWFRPLNIAWFYERVFIEYALEDPQLLSSMRILPAWLDFYSDDLTDQSLARESELNGKLRDDLATLRHYDRDGLEPSSRLSYDILEYFLAIQVEGERFQHHNYPLNQLFGIQNELPTFLATQHPVYDERDAKNYLARLDKIPVTFDQVLEGLRLRESREILPPSFVVDKVLAEMRAFVGADADDNILYTSFAGKLAELAADELDTQAREQLLDEARRLIADRVYSAYGRLIDYYEELRPEARPDNGVWDLPDGAEYYAWAVRYHTMGDMTPDEVHELGLSEVVRIEAEMDAILRAEGLESGSIGERVQRIAARPGQSYPDNDSGRRQVLAEFQAIIDEADARLEPWFDVRPDSGVRVERIPEFREKTALGAYYEAPAFDGSRPGIFYTNLRTTGEIARFTMRTLAYHEAIPGHHFQIAIQQELKGVPTFRRILPFTAFSEGWALYAERLASEAGFHPGPLDEIGRLQAEMFRAVRLVVDSGMHARRWGRERAIAYMRDNTGMGETEVVAEIERYLVVPGQALAYKVGMNHILALRDRARTALGERFDVRRFHNVVLTGGSMPLTLLSERVEEWIEAEMTGR